jgi:hypothetical protein
MTFADIERVTGVKLPPKAQGQRAWWSNNSSNNVMTKVWLSAGFRTEQVDIAARKLVFRRARERLAQPRASAERHPLFGALKGLVQVMPDTDLTAPADPHWGSD